ncbi:MAG TPA: nitroreductase family protein [Bacillaceae bacterium]
MKEFNMEEYRQSEYEADPVFLNRWSPRAFQEKEIPENDLFSLFEAARWAPSAFNAQPWRFMIARTKEERERFYSFIMEGNLAWCRKAPVLALIMSKKTTDQGPSSSHGFDTGAAWANLSIQAAKKGLITHAMGGFHREQARALLNIPEDYQLHAVIAIGYQGDKSELPETLQEREKPSGRMSLDDILFEHEFSKPAKR